MILAEAGYTESKHNARITQISQSNHSDISDVIHAVCQLYQDLYNVDKYNINCGMCEDFAHDIAYLTNNQAIPMWNDEIDDLVLNCAHCVIYYHEKYYDSQHPFGSTKQQLLLWDIFADR